MPRLSSEEYSTFLQSERWRTIRKRKLDSLEVPGCEFEVRDGHQAYPEENWVACGSLREKSEKNYFNRELHVHHLTYDRIGGREKDDDLQVLCSYHHAVAELLKKNCVRCWEPVFDDYEDASREWLFATEGEMYVPSGGGEYNWLDCLNLALSDAPSLCSYCDHMCR